MLNWRDALSYLLQAPSSGVDSVIADQSDTNNLLKQTHPYRVFILFLFRTLHHFVLTLLRMAIGLPEPGSGIRISMDRGGTFTDCVATVPGQDDIVVKLLSADPTNYPDAPVEAIRRVLEKATGRPYPKGHRISLQGVGK